MDESVVFLLADPEYFESPDCIPADAELMDTVARQLPNGWTTGRTGVWLHCTPPAFPFRAQAWKVHVSATLDNCIEVLRRTSEVCIRRGQAFKFVPNLKLLEAVNSKTWPRGSAGKFVTIYPVDDRMFVALLEELNAALGSLHGPYILSDRRYRGSEVLYYRFGGVLPKAVLTPSGSREPMLVTPTGELVPDVRAAYFDPPAWAHDPTGSMATPAATTMLVGNGRYRIEGALNFSAAGGVYSATDLATDREVVIKEARAHVGNLPNGLDAIVLLKKEHAILKAMAGTGVAPAAIDLFQDWEHWFLVEERIEGRHLGQFVSSEHPLLGPEPTLARCSRYLTRAAAIWRNLATALQHLHARRICFGDVAPQNVFVNPATCGVRLIDFECAQRGECDPPNRLMSAGFVSLERRLGDGGASVADDLYGLGSIMLHTLWPVGRLLMLDQGVKPRMLEAMARELGVPARWIRLIEHLMTEDKPLARPTLSETISVLDVRETYAAPSPQPAPAHERLRETVEGILAFTWSRRDFSREDRLFPAGPAVFFTNPQSVAHGAAGIAYGLHQINGEVPEELRQWMVSHPVTREDYTASLYFGAAGVAWVLAAIGQLEAAAAAYDVAIGHPLLYASADLLRGSAGCGLAALYLWRVLGDPRYLSDAIRIGEQLLIQRQEDAQGSHWTSVRGDIPVGLGSGASGVASFLLYLFLASGEQRFLEVGKSALLFDLAEGREMLGTVQFPRLARDYAVVYPYLEFGTAGVLQVLLRYQRVTKDESMYRDINRLAPAVLAGHSVSPTLFTGLAGVGNCLLDCHEFLREARFRQAAGRVAANLISCRLERPAGLAFSDAEQMRLSCDYAAGSMGVALFLNRWRLGKCNFDFTLDWLLACSTQWMSGAAENIG